MDPIIVQQDDHNLSVRVTTGFAEMNFPSRTVHIRDWRRASGDVRFSIIHPLMGPVEVAITWTSDKPAIKRRTGKLVNFSADYLMHRIDGVVARGTVRGTCLLNATAGGPNYIPISLNEPGFYINTNFHQVLTYVGGLLPDGWMKSTLWFPTVVTT